MPLVCPQCGALYRDDAAVIGNRDIRCTSCDWTGNSRNLLIVDESAKDLRVFDELASWFAQEGGASLYIVLNRHGVLPTSNVPKELSRLARTYIAGLMEAVLDPGRVSEGTPVYDHFAFDFAKIIAPDVLRRMVQLGIFERSDDPKNLAFMGAVSMHGLRKLREALPGAADKKGEICS